MAEKKRIRTAAIRGGYDARMAQYGDLIPPLHRSVTFVKRTCQEAVDAFTGVIKQPTYARFGDTPTLGMLEQKLALLEGGEAAIVTGTGMSAIDMLARHYCSAGDTIVASPYLYGGTQHLFYHRLSFSNINVKFVRRPENPHEWSKAIDDRTQFLFLETPTNPHGFVYDIAAIAEIAHNRKRPLDLVVDSTIATPAILRPLEWGADVVVHSITKAMTDSDAMGGAIVGSHKLIDHLRTNEYRDIGCAVSPDNAWLAWMSLRTLVERTETHSKNAERLSSVLTRHPCVRSVWYPFHPSHPSYELAKRQMDGGPGLLYFEVAEGAQEAAWRVIDSLKFIYNAVHLGASETLATHCFTTTHRSLSPEDKDRFLIVPGGIRIAVGREDFEDIWSDLEAAL